MYQEVSIEHIGILECDTYPRNNILLSKEGIWETLNHSPMWMWDFTEYAYGIRAVVA